MADDDKAQQPEKKKSPIMLFAIVGGLMVAEAIGVYLLVKMTSAAPSTAAELELEGGSEDDDERIVEIPLLHERFQNRSTGRVWLWETEVVLKVRNRNVELINRQLERRAAEVKEGVAKIVGRALDRQLAEPGRETIDRQLTAYCNDIFGLDADGMPRIEDVLIPTLHGAPADF